MTCLLILESILEALKNEIFRINNTHLGLLTFFCFHKSYGILHSAAIAQLLLFFFKLNFNFFSNSNYSTDWIRFKTFFILIMSVVKESDLLTQYD